MGVGVFLGEEHATDDLGAQELVSVRMAIVPRAEGAKVRGCGAKRRGHARLVPSAPQTTTTAGAFGEGKAKGEITAWRQLLALGR